MSNAARSLESAHALLTDPEAAAGTGHDEGAIMAASAHALVGIGFALVETNRWLENIYEATKHGGRT